MKIEIGKQYKVHGGEEDGNVIKITEKKNGLCRYETISGKKPFVDQFECDSLFARLLTPCSEETKKPLYLCDPQKNTACPKGICQMPNGCFFTTKKEFAKDEKSQ